MKKKGIYISDKGLRIKDQSHPLSFILRLSFFTSSLSTFSSRLSTRSFSLFAFSLFLFFSFQLSSQNISINADGSAPDGSAMLDVSDTTRGFLPPRMTTTQMNNVVSPANGLMVYNTDSAGYFYHDGVNWLSITSLSPTSSTVDNVGEAGVVIIKDLKSSGVTGGPSLDKTWEERDLNTIEGDNSFITLSSNQFTLNAGVYLINWSSPGYGVNYFVTRLYNVTESRTESEGEALFSTVTGINRTSSGKTIIEIPSQKVFSIQQYSSLNSSSGLGADVNVGINELYTQVEIIKLDKVFGSGANAL